MESTNTVMLLVYAAAWLESTNTFIPCDDNLAAYLDLIENCETFIIEVFNFLV